MAQVKGTGAGRRKTYLNIVDKAILPKTRRVLLQKARGSNYRFAICLFSDLEFAT